MPHSRDRSRSRGGERRLSRRGLLVVLGGGVTAGGILSTDAFSSGTAVRNTRQEVATDSNALLGLTNFNPEVVYDEPNEVTVTNNAGIDLTGTNEVRSANGDLQFRRPGTKDQNNPLSLSDLPTGDGTSFEIVTAADRSGVVRDTVTVYYEQSSGSSIEVTRDLAVEFESGGQLIYAVDNNDFDGDIKVYDAINDVLNDPPQTTKADVIGARAADIVGDSDADIPYLSKNDDENAYATTVGKNSDTAIPKGNEPNLRKQKTRLALRKWPPASLSGNLILAADNNSERIVGIDGSGNTEIIATPPNGCGGVAGVNDIDDDGSDEMVFVDSSQEMRYLEQDGTTVKIQNGSVGSDKSTGFGSPTDFDGDGVPKVPFIDGSNIPAVVTADGTKTVLNDTGIAKKAAIAPVDLDGDGTPEFTFLDIDSGEIRYIDDVLGSNTVKTLHINGSPVAPLVRTGLNTQG
jgi:hypothetical protein